MSSQRFAGPMLDLDFWLGVLNGERRGAKYDALRAGLAGASSLYNGGLEAYLAAERIGLRSRTVLPVPVISIGNLTSGGTGKTPMTHYVAHGLQQEGFRPAVLSRGHGGTCSSEGGQVSDESGDILLTAHEGGDEAVALARLLPGVPVFIGKNRRKSAAAALARCRPDLFLLDDGLQYWQLARDLDIVLLDSRKPFDNGYTLPRGALREPKSHLRRAGIIVITRADLANREQLSRTYDAARRLAPGTPIFHACHRFAGLRPLNEMSEKRLPERPVAVCGIAQPKAFVSLLESAGVYVTPERLIELDDHAVYDQATLDLINGKIMDCRADSVITTEKDAVKLPADAFQVPVFAAELKIELDRPADFWSELKRRSKLVVS